MLTWLKFILLVLVLLFSLQGGWMGLAFLSLAVAALALRHAPAHLVRRNMPIVMFSVLFSLLAVISGIIKGDVPSIDIARNAFAIILCYNFVFLGAAWIGHEGLHRLMAAVPSLRLRLYLVVFAGLFQSLSRSHRALLAHLRSRLNIHRERWRIARYYGQNLMEKELYSLRHYQAAIVSRLTDIPVLAWGKEHLTMGQLPLLLFMAVLALANAAILVTGAIK